MTAAKATAISFCIYVAIAIAGWAIMPRGGFWVNDQGLKYLQVASFASGDGGALQPPEWIGARDFPAFPREVVREVDGKLFVIYPEAFAWWLSLWVRVGGDAMLRLHSLLFGITATALMTCIGLRLHRRSAWLIPLMVLASPLMFYHWVLWEHTLAVALLAGSVLALICAKERSLVALGAGLIAGLAIFIRPDAVLFAMAVGGAMLITSRPWRTIVAWSLGALAMLATFCIYNQLRWGHPLGLYYAGVQDAGVADSSKLRTLVNLLTGHSSYAGMALCVLLCWLIFISARWQRRWLVVASMLVLGTYAAHVLVSREPDPFLRLIDTGGLLLVCPALLFAWSTVRARKGRREVHVLLLASALYLALVLLTCPEVTSAGVHVGPRILLPLFSLTIPLSARAIIAALRLFRRRTKVLLTACVAAFFLFGFFDTWRSGALQRSQLTHNAAVDTFLAAQPDTFLVTTIFWYGEVHSREWPGKTFVYTTWKKVPALANAMREQGATSYLLATDVDLSPNATPIAIPGAPDRGTIMDARLYRVPLE